jgi:hypothetical protein
MEMPQLPTPEELKQQMLEMLREKMYPEYLEYCQKAGLTPESLEYFEADTLRINFPATLDLMRERIKQRIEEFKSK